MYPHFDRCFEGLRLAKKRCHRLAVAGIDGMFRPMMPLLHHPAAADHHVAYGIAVPGEDQGIEERVLVAAEERGRFLVKHHEVCPCAGRNAADVASGCSGAAGKGETIEPGTYMTALLRSRRQDIAPAGDQPLAIFEPAQLFDRADRDVTVGADAEPAVAGKVWLCWEQSVAEIGLGGRAQARDGAARRQKIGLGLCQMSCV